MHTCALYITPTYTHTLTPSHTYTYTHTSNMYKYEEEHMRGTEGSPVWFGWEGQGGDSCEIPDTVKVSVL